jgi:hypothetical protein
MFVTRQLSVNKIYYVIYNHFNNKIQIIDHLICNFYKSNNKFYQIY